MVHLHLKKKCFGFVLGCKYILRRCLDPMASICPSFWPVWPNLHLKYLKWFFIALHITYLMSALVFAMAQEAPADVRPPGAQLTGVVLTEKHIMSELLVLRHYRPLDGSSDHAVPARHDGRQASNTNRKLHKNHVGYHYRCENANTTSVQKVFKHLKPPKKVLKTKNKS